MDFNQTFKKIASQDIKYTGFKITTQLRLHILNNLRFQIYRQVRTRVYNGLYSSTTRDLKGWYK